MRNLGEILSERESIAQEMQVKPLTFDQLWALGWSLQTTISSNFPTAEEVKLMFMPGSGFLANGYLAQPLC